ncbi:bifunctional DNA primase/polymerase [Limosilactobacillus fermentum]|uniref:bifunctional DNA primase/polymerase n=1 Tax=Limosilactobacillus fermentum TaxID=1613 RepID=UPI0018830EA7|nr:bifunctional DNA primase/polymerase [Limosilactobacillus fermentum]MBE8117570.1 bifunctional DNA primase/polymerase [Limosilactobacillus fermentum]
MEAKRRALQLAQAGVPVYPLAPGSKTPPKGHHGYREATTDTDTILRWSDDWGLGIDLFTAGMLVVDLDRPGTTTDGKAVHGGKDGVKALKIYLEQHQRQLPHPMYAEQTPHGGLHLFFKLDQPLERPTRKTNALPGVDILGDFVIASPSEVNGSPYLVMQDQTQPVSIHDTATAPQWIVGLLTAPQTAFNPAKANSLMKGHKTYTGRLFDKIAQGADEGERNNWLASVTGSILNAGTDPANAYYLIGWINERFISPPLDDREVNAVFKSVCKYH